MGAVVRAKPDGYTIGLATNLIMAYQPLVNSGLAFKSSDDYQPMVKLIDLPNVLFVRADAPWKTFNEFIADARKNPGKMRVSVAALRGTNVLEMQQFNMLSGVRLVMVPFHCPDNLAAGAGAGGVTAGPIAQGLQQISGRRIGRRLRLMCPAARSDWPALRRIHPLSQGTPPA